MYKAYLVPLLLLALLQGIKSEEEVEVKDQPKNESFIGSRIIGGSSASVGQFPYQVSLRTSGLNHICGGSIIDRNWIVTAAHCISGTNIRYVVAGTIYLLSGGVRLDVAKSIQHPQYSPSTLKNDIALIKTVQLLNYNTNIKPIALPSFNVGGGVGMVASGWGAFTLSNLGVIPNNLQYLAVNTLTNTECQKRLNIGDTQLCTYRSVGKGICYGDSGGPIMYANQLHGIASFVAYIGDKTCAAGFPDGLTRVFKFNAWILSTKLVN